MERELGEHTRFFTSLSHEIRTPLNHLLGGISLLEISEAPEQREAYGGMIRDSAGALTRFVDDLVDFARDTTGRETVRTAPFVPRDPVDFAMRAVAGGAAENGLELRAEIASDLPETWTGDEARVGRMLINLAGNAIRFTATGSVALAAGVESGRLVYSVADTGPGVEETYRQSIFTAFDRGDPSTSRNTNGSGLGLSIARGSARVMGATLELAPQSPSGGATLVVTLEPGGAVQRAGKFGRSSL